MIQISKNEDEKKRKLTIIKINKYEKYNSFRKEQHFDHSFLSVKIIISQ